MKCSSTLLLKKKKISPIYPVIALNDTVNLPKHTNTHRHLYGICIFFSVVTTSFPMELNGNFWHKSSFSKKKRTHNPVLYDRAGHVDIGTGYITVYYVCTA